MSDGSYWNGKRWVKAEDFRRPPPAPKPTPQSKPQQETDNGTSIKND